MAASAPPAAPATAPALALEDAWVVRGGHPILRGIDLVVPRGAVTGLLGPSGCGKSTLMRSVVGLQRLTSGRATVLDRPAGSPELRSRVAYVAQGPSVYRDLTVGENLDYFARLIGAGPDDVEAALEATDLAGLRGRRVASLSGGQTTRVSLATALLGRPELLVLDEPTVGLDPILREELWATMRGLADRGATLLVSSHVMDEAAYCDVLLLMREGRILAEDAPDALRARTGADDMSQAFVRIVRARQAGGEAPRTAPRRRWRPARPRPEAPRPKHAAATVARVLHQLRHDPLTVALVLVIPIILLALMRYVFPGPDTFRRIGVPLVGIFPFMSLFMVTSVSFLRERMAATLERLMTLPIARLDLVAGYAGAFTLVAAIQTAMTIAFGFGVLGMHSERPVALVALVAVVAALAGAALGILSSTIARSEFQAVLWMGLLVLPQVMLCGLLVPRDEMAAVLEGVSAALPLTYVYDLLDRIASGAALPAGRVALDAGALALGTVVPLAVATFTLRRSSR
ncbi:MAG: ABC transporter ATP-binding protein/permease [Solirubrobacteraceae bacterium]|nr:ABC transporter ATP-binding protein/permease [Solirubrobacteraceae bacterium]